MLAASILASALGFIDGSLVAIAMPAMRTSLDATLVQAQWINNAYMLPLSALILAGGALGDRFGLGRVFSAGIAVFLVASLLSAIAPSPDALIAARALKGVGAAAMIPGSLSLIYRAYPREARGRAIGIWAGASALTTALGPVVAGAALTLIGPGAWRWLFALNLPLGILAIWLILGAVENDHGNSAKGIDVVGALLASAALGLLAFGLTGLSNGQGTVPLLIGGLGLLLFVWWEHRTTDPMMSLSLFASRTFSAANVATFCLYFGLSAVLFFLPMTVIAGWGVTEAQASVAFIPLTVFIALFSARAGRMADTYGPGPLIALGAAVTAIAFAGLGLTAHLQRFWDVTMPLMALMGAGMCFVVAPLSAAVMGAVPDQSAGAASGINNAVTRISGLVAVAAMGAVAAIGYSAAGGIDSFGAPGTGEAHVNAMNAGFRAVALVTAGLSGISALVAWVGISKPVQIGS
ncbi:MAG: MFS transporter [Pseudomonadota bacterium]